MIKTFIQEHAEKWDELIQIDTESEKVKIYSVDKGLDFPFSEYYTTLQEMGYTSLKGALMARGTREISRLIKAMGGNEMSAYGLCHLGDYEATLFSKFSHNRRFGEMLINGEKFDKLAEGVSTTRALVKLSQRYNVDLPIVNAVNQVITYNKDPKETLSSLFLRSIKDEF